MAKNTSEMSDEEYEQLTQNIHRELLKLEGFDTIEVLHNQKIMGRSGQPHQIDVYWRFKVAGSIYQTAIECKQYRKRISVGKLRDFLGVLTDVGNISGIFVTTTGYQSGAKKIASHYGIRLLELRSPTDIDLTGLIRKIVVNMHFKMTQIVAIRTEISAEWIKNNHPEFLDEPFLISGMTDELGLHDAQGNLVRSWWSIGNTLPTEDEFGNCLMRGMDLVYDVNVSEFYVKHEKIGLVPLKAAQITYKITEANEVTHIEDDEKGRYIVRDAFASDVQHFQAEGSIIRAKPKPQS